jgi:uncharacterized protein YdaT
MKKVINRTDPLRTGKGFTQANLPAGPYIAEVKSVGDPMKNNRVSVALLDTSDQSTNDNPTQWIDVTIALPHYGITPHTTKFNSRSIDEYEGGNSYGMTIPEPDVGTKCLVVFANSDRAKGFIIAFIPDAFQNTTTAGRGVAKLKGKIAFSEADKSEFYSLSNMFPVLEKNLKSLKSVSVSGIQQLKWSFDKLMTKILQGQGLLLDKTRGVTSSSTERQSPNSVVGMSTKGRSLPDPLDNPAILEKYKNSPDTLTLSEVDTLSRKPGHSLALDDGGIDGENNLIRLRSSKGAQILLHDTKDLIYIANSKGTSWVEITSEGKIDIFATDSVSLHTKGDYNITADENFNVTAKNINMMASGNTDIVTTGITSIDSVGTIGIRSTENILQKGALIHMNSSGNLPPEHTGQATARIPNHEPWGQHEDYEATSFTQDKTAAGNTNQVSVTIGTDGVLVVGTSSTGE